MARRKKLEGVLLRVVGLWWQRLEALAMNAQTTPNTYASEIIKVWLMENRPLTRKGI